MDWKKLLGTITASVDEEIRLRNTYLVAENRMLRQQINGRVQLTDGDRRTLAELGQKLGRQALAEIATVAKPDTILAWHRTFADQKVAPSERHRSVGPVPVLTKKLKPWWYVWHGKIVRGAMTASWVLWPTWAIRSVIRRWGIS
jgi:hypothetical protein